MSGTIRMSEWRTGDRAVVRVAGRLTAGPPAERLLRRVRALVERGARDLTLDLERVTALDCGGIGLLLLCRQAALGRGARLRVTGAGGPIRMMLLLSDLLGPLGAGERIGGPAAGHRSPAGRDAPLLLSA